MNTENKNTGAQFEALLPKCLDDLIRINRDQASLGLATPEEIMGLHYEIIPRKPKETLNDWRLIALHIKPLNQTQFFMLGYLSFTGTPRITSDVKHMDLDRGLIMTRNSLYALGKSGEGEPHFEHLLLVCAAFHRWGMGAVLGMLEVFY